MNYRRNIAKPMKRTKSSGGEAYEALEKQCDEEDLDSFLANFKKDLQRNITPVGDIKFPPLDDKLDEITMSKVFF